MVVLAVSAISRSVVLTNRSINGKFAVMVRARNIGSAGTASQGAARAAFLRAHRSASVHGCMSAPRGDVADWPTNTAGFVNATTKPIAHTTKSEGRPHR